MSATSRRPLRLVALLVVLRLANGDEQPNPLAKYFVRPAAPVCHSCVVPHPTAIHWIPYARPPCLHPGQPIFVWPSSSSSCPSARAVRSAAISADVSGVEKLVFAKERLCFYDTVHVIEFEFECGSLRLRSQFRLGHTLFSKLSNGGRHRRVKRDLRRWSRRRNPQQGAIQFQQQSYVKELAEDAAVGSVVARVSATHAAGHLIFYSMAAPQDARSQNLFTLDTHTGEIRLAKPLDRETLEKHVLKVTAFERLDPSVAAAATVVVDVLDVQDNAPVFERESYFTTIREDAPIGTTVVSVFARDRDAGANGEVEYSLEKSEGSDLFKINAKSGVIQTAKELDRETQALIRFHVIAQDHGSPRKDSKSLVEINVSDANDNAPVFAQESYNITVLENVTVPVVVAKLEAVDLDADANGQVHYGMVTSSDILHVDYKTGEVTLRKKLDARNGPWTFVVRAKDGAQPAQSSTATLTLNVLDINDHAPKFLAATKQVLVDEGVGAGEEIVRVYAIDEDAGENGRIRYSLEGSGDFRIDADTGVVTATRTLDRERTQRYELTIRASDGGVPQLSASTSMIVIVRDVNDNAPSFSPAAVEVTLSEETPVGAQIAVVKAADLDEAGKLYYRVEHEDRPGLVALIDLGEQGALLSLSRPLQPDDGAFSVVVSATDDGGLRGNVTLLVHVTDVNSAPRFPPQPFAVRVPEDAPAGFPVIGVRAEDSDRGENARLRYSIDSDRFAIDAATGEISVAAPLDREEHSSHSVTVTATDSADPPLSSSTIIEITLDDVNDNAPEFSSLNYSATVSEDIAVGTSFLQVAAIDPDAGPNGIVDFYLNATGIGAELFRLDRTSGTLRVNQKLDRETLPIITLPIYAQDRGMPPLRADSQIIVYLQDVNDNAPRFSQSSYDLWIAENAPSGTLVGTLIASDPDEAENADIVFRVFDGADAKFFELEADPLQKGVARLLARHPFDYEAKTNAYQLEVQASSGQLSSTVPVRVHVSDVNDHAPTLRPSVLLVNRFEHGAPIEHVGTIPAFDPDQNATLEFSLEANDLLAVDRYSGKLSLQGVWKRSIDARLKACVSDAANTVCSSLRVLHSFVPAAWLAESVSVLLRGSSLDDFLDPDVFARFRQSIASLRGWAERSVVVLAIEARDASTELSFVVVEHGQLVSASKVEDLIASSTARLTSLSLLDISLSSRDSCTQEPCPYYQKCRETLKFVGHQFHQTDNFLAHSFRTLRTFACECPPGFMSSPDLPSSCNVRVDTCFAGPCAHNGTCTPLENSYRCTCSDGWTGKNCELSTNVATCIPNHCASGSVCELRGRAMVCAKCKHSPEDTDERCRLRSVHFDGVSQLRLPQTLGRIEWTVELSFATLAKEGTLLFVGNRERDFVELSIQDRILRVQFSLGGETQTAKLQRERHNRINDGTWHKATLQYFARALTLFLDDCDPVVSRLALGERSCAARAVIDLPAKCLDPTVPCHRFFDASAAGLSLGARRLSAPSLNTSLTQIENGYKGCIANLTINGELVDFSNLHELEKVGRVDEGCGPRRDFCSDSGCGAGAHCVNRCPHSHHQQGTCSSEQHRPRPVTLGEEESFQTWKIPSAAAAAASPLEASFEFRTIREDTQIMALEFDDRNVEDGFLKASLGETQVVIECPDATRGHWTKVEIELKLEELTVIVDGIYTASMPCPADLTVTEMYSGIAPSSSHPARFEGCIREVRLNGVYLKHLHAGKVRQGCVSTRGCQAGSCPENSLCKSQWEGHKCECDLGFAGAACDAICSLKGICGSGGMCQTMNSSRGYECHCASGFTGLNCERTAALKKCPVGYFGRFGDCKRCDCPSHKGFSEQCHAESGQCLCPKFSFESRGRCVPCECGLGAASLECDGEGQCPCAGQATGRRCDRCATNQQVLDAKSLRCLSLRDRCPSQIDEGMQWPTALRGATARQSCPYTELGLATRQCGDDGNWREVNAYNCTKPEFAAVGGRSLQLGAAELVTAIFNATRDEHALRGRNLEIARSVLERVLEAEIVNGAPSHDQDDEFVLRMVDALAQILAKESSFHSVLLSARVAALGRVLLESHLKKTYLAPFAVQTSQIMFAVDRLDSKAAPLPKFNNFLNELSADFPTVEIRVGNDADWVFYQVIPNPRCAQCASPLVAVEINSTQDVSVSFPVKDDAGWKYPECVRFAASETDQWLEEPAALAGLNQTHATCVFGSPGMFALKMKVDSGILLRLSFSAKSPAAPVSVAAGLLLLGLSLALTATRKGLRTRPIRVAFVLAFAAHAAHNYVTQRATISMVFCGVRNALLAFTSVSPFCWLFLYSLHIYRMLSEGNTQTRYSRASLGRGFSAAICLLIGLALPCCLSVFSFLVSSSCSLAPSHWLFWTIVLPVALFLLLSFYACATCLLIARDKHFEVVVVKFALRRTLWQHFLLTAFTTAYTAAALLLPAMPAMLPPNLAEIIVSVLLLLTCVYILVWSCAFGRSHDSMSERVETLWIHGEPPKSVAIDQGCTSPLLYGARRAETNAAWTTSPSDRVPSDPFVMPRPIGGLSLRENPLAPTILSPANKILKITDSVEYSGTLSRIGRYDDEMEDAYYTYQRRKLQQSTFQK